MSLSSLFSSLLHVVHGDTQEEKEVVQTNSMLEEDVVDKDESPEEPEDLHPAVHDECKQTAKCASLTKHFEHCQEKVSSGQGYKGEDCVEELFHMMHCADGCAAPKLFSKLK